MMGYGITSLAATLALAVSLSGAQAKNSPSICHQAFERTFSRCPGMVGGFGIGLAHMIDSAQRASIKQPWWDNPVRIPLRQFQPY